MAVLMMITDGHNPLPDTDKAVEVSLHVQV